MPFDVILPLLLAALVALVLVAFLRRAGRALARSRELERYRQETAELAERVEAVLGPLVARVDSVRHGQVPATEITDELRAGMAALGEALDVAREIRQPSGIIGAPDLAGQVDRAIRAVDTILYGCGLASDSAGRRGKELEAQTSIKRGYLNLLHSREAVAEEAGRARAAAELVPRSRWRASRV